MCRALSVGNVARCASGRQRSAPSHLRLIVEHLVALLQDRGLALRPACIALGHGPAAASRCRRSQRAGARSGRSGRTAPHSLGLRRGRLVGVGHCDKGVEGLPQPGAGGGEGVEASRVYQHQRASGPRLCVIAGVCVRVATLRYEQSTRCATSGRSGWRSRQSRCIQQGWVRALLPLA